MTSIDETVDERRADDRPADDPRPDGGSTDRRGSRLPWRRDVQRWLHLALAALLGVYVYSPLHADPTVGLVVRVGVFPALGLSGLLLWRGGRLRAWLRTRSRRAGR